MIFAGVPLNAYIRMKRKNVHPSWRLRFAFAVKLYQGMDHCCIGIPSTYLNQLTK